MVRLGAVGEQDAVEAVDDQRVGVAAAAGRGALGLEAGPAQARLGEGQGRRGGRDPVAAEELFDPHVGVAAVLAGAPGAGVAERTGDLGRPVRVEAARLGDDLAVAGDDVARGAAADHADVGGRLLVEPAQLHARDRRRGGGDRVVAVLGPDAGMGLDPGEVRQHALLGRRGDDHLADRAGVVEDEAALASAAGSASKALAPRSPCSSATVSTSSIPTGGGVAPRAARPAP